MYHRATLSVLPPVAASRMGRRLLLLVLLAAGRAQAQAPGTGGPTPGPAAAVPLDGGASLLLAAGVAYGLKRLRRGEP